MNPDVTLNVHVDYHYIHYLEHGINLPNIYPTITTLARLIKDYSKPIYLTATPFMSVVVTRTVVIVILMPLFSYLLYACCIPSIYLPISILRHT